MAFPYGNSTSKVSIAGGSKYFGSKRAKSLISDNFSNKIVSMAEIKIFHTKERPYISDAINAYYSNNEQISSEWKAWLDHLLDGLQTDKDVIQVEDKNNYLQSFYDMVLASYINDEFRRARNSPNIINGFCYGNTGHFLRGWSF